MTRGKFIVFEGGEGAGKTTQVERLAYVLGQLGAPVTTTREPGGTTIGSYLRSLLLAHKMPSRTEALLYLADRAAHAEQVIRPALERGEVVISDRFADSSSVYQGLGRGLGLHLLSDMSHWATDGLTPDLVFVLDIDPRVGLDRVQATRGRRDRIESEGLEFHDTVRAGFLELARTADELGSGTRYCVVDASQSVGEISAEIAVLARTLVLGDYATAGAEAVAE